MVSLRSAGSSIAGLFAFVSAFAPPAAQATYSIVAADRATRQVGGAVTSCVFPNAVDGVYGSAPGRGAVASQAASNRRARDVAVMLLLMDVAPEQIITRITAANFDQGSAQRQYGVVDLMGRAAGHSGGSNGVFSNDVQGEAGTFTYSVQGNILTGAAVLSQASAAFQRDACDLAERLMRALEAGATGNQGDRRCTPSGAPADSAFLQVDQPGEPAGSYLKLSVRVGRRMNPLPALRTQFDAWRRTHPCPSDAPDGGAPPPPADANASRDSAVADTGVVRVDGGATQGGGRIDAGGGGSAGAGGSGGASGGIAGAGGGATAGAGGVAGAAGGMAGAADGGAGAAGAMAGAPGMPPGVEGCQCGVGGRAGSGGGFVMVALAAVVLRRRRRSR